MSAIGLSTAVRTGIRLQGRIKLARLLEMPEAALETQVRETEADPLFRRLTEAGALAIRPFPRARYAQRVFAGRHLCASGPNLSGLLDGDGEIARLLKRVGSESFERCFLGDAAMTDAERAAACGVTERQARALREFVNRFYLRSEFAEQEPAAPALVYSTVAGIGLEEGRPVLVFFNREAWKGRYVFDEERWRSLRKSLAPADAERAERLRRRLELIAYRRTTLHRLLELLVVEQAAYLASGDPTRRRPLTQRAVAARLRVATSVLCQLIGNKAVETPWRLEIPLKTLFPSRKAMMRERLYDLAMERPEAADNTLRDAMRRLYGASLSRPSIIQYRKELGLAACGRRALEAGV